MSLLYHPAATIRDMADMLAFMGVSLHHLTMNEQEPQLPSPKPAYVDVLKELQCGDFFDAVSQVEAYVDQANDAAAKAEHIEVLEELFGIEYQDGMCTVLASSYQRQEDGYLTVRSSFFHAAGVVYEGIVIEAIDDEERVLIKYHEYETDTEHFVLPDSLLQLEISETATEGIIDILRQQLSDFKRLVSSDTFLSMSYEQQQEALQQKFSSIKKDLDTYAGNDRVEIDCEGYYSIPDTRMTIDLDDAYMEQSENKYIESFRPSGKVVGVSLLEGFESHEADFFSGVPRPYRQLDEFTKSGGVPCIILRDESEHVKVTYMVQLDAVQDIVCIDTSDEPDEGDD